MWKSKDFIGRKKDTMKHFKEKGYSRAKVSEYCTLAGIPLVVVYEWISEEFPEHKEDCLEKIRLLNKFYGVFGDSPSLQSESKG